MTVKDISKIEGLRLAAEGNMELPVSRIFCSDLSSIAMGKAPADCAWFTVMSNVNVCAVATLTDCAAVVLCEGTEPDAALMERAAQNEVNLLITGLPVYEAAVKFAANLN